MSENAREENVLFRVTRERTTIFHPDRSVSVRPILTGGEIELPRSVAEYHAKNGVGEIVDPKAKTAEKAAVEPQDDPQEKVPARRPGRPAKAAQ